MIIKNKLTFKNSPIYPDNSHIRWEMDGKGFIGNHLVFKLNHPDDDDESYTVQVFEPHTKHEHFPNEIAFSPIFWEATEWSKIPNNKNFNYNARRTAMQWAEDYFLNAVTNQFSLS
jgi:hypothetical protein